jgi:hypothetical protein
MANKLSGGGIGSNKLVHPSVRTGPASTNKISERGVSQYGYATGSKIDRGNYTTANSALPVNQGTMKQVPLGNQVALNVVGRAGPGAGREVHRSGSQGQHGAPAQGSSPGPRDILSEFGRDAPAASMVHRRGA